MNSVYLLLLSLFTASAVEYTIDHAIVTPLMSSPQFSPRAYKEPLTGATTSALETAIPVVIFPLAEATVDTSTWYYTVKVSSTNPDSSYTITSIPFCNLLLPASSVSKVVKETIVMTPNLVGEPLSATLRVTNKKTSSKGSSLCGVVDSSVLKEKFISTLQTSFDIDLGDKADSIPLKVQNPPPLGLQILPRPKGDTTFKTMGKDPTAEKKQQSQSFLGKYWWVILPLAVMTLTAPSEEPAKGK